MRSCRRPGWCRRGAARAKSKELALFLAIDGAGSVLAFNGHVDLGTGVKTALTQIVAEELNLRMDRYRWCWAIPSARPIRGDHRQRYAADFGGSAAQSRRHGAAVAAEADGRPLADFTAGNRAE